MLSDEKVNIKQTRLPPHLILTQKFPVVGRVPISFYIPESKRKEQCKLIIEAHGGVVLDTFEPYMYQLRLENESKGPKHYFSGNIYHFRMVTEAIKLGYMMPNVESFLAGFNKKGRELTGVNKKPYTFLEMAKLYDIVYQQYNQTLLRGDSANKLSKEDEENEVIPLVTECYKENFWELVENKHLIPGRTKKGLRACYRKFLTAKASKKAALAYSLENPSNGRYSHIFKYKPIVNEEVSPEKTAEKSPDSNNNCDASSSREDQEVEIFCVESPGKEPSDTSDIQEFVLAVEDLQSVVSYRESNDQAYNMKTNLAKKNNRRLTSMYTDFEEDCQFQEFGNKRVKVSESTEISYPLYENEELTNYTENIDKLYLQTDLTMRVRYVSKAQTKTSRLEAFKMVSELLKDLAYKYHVPLDVIHMKFFEVSCDFGLLKASLEGNNVGWSLFEDLTIKNISDNHKAVDYLDGRRPQEDILRRKKFLQFTNNKNKA